MKAYTFERIQSGYWGRTHLGKTVVVKAESENAARFKLQHRKDWMKRLSNGDTLSWTLTGTSS